MAPTNLAGCVLLQVCCGAVLGVLFGIFYPNPTAGMLLVGA
jgi:uncharacterized membrane protein